ncbi:hypothetical protein HYT05_03245, partial [Candidatus Kaiserbacteria bacterium]|nr:hypothetical protein [Candidatus Kaiserbacteria bacterium]
MHRKKILIIAPYGFNDRMVNFIEFVSARLLARGGWDVTALVQSDTSISSKETLCGITVYRYAHTSEGLRLLLSLLLRERPAIIHAHNLRNNRVGIVGAIFSRLLRIRLICTEYGLLHDHYLTDFRDDPLNHETHPERIVHSLIELARRIIANPRRSRYFASSYLFHWPLAHADHLVFVSKHNLPIARSLRLPPATYLPQTSDEFRWQVGDADVPDVREDELTARIATLSGNTVLFIGQMKRRKGWDVLLRAIPHTDPSAIAQFVFVSSSTTSERAEFTELVETLNVRDRIVFLGKVPNNALLHELYE